ncbi:MAG: glutamine amidotransferase [Clostridia bacterium]|nr:glutamine amidotransferase [Clostridia bacterium]
MKIKILHLFPDLLDWYFDSGNILCMRKRLEWRKIDCEVISVRQNDPFVDLSDIDIILIGGGVDDSQRYACKSLLGYKNELNRYIDDEGSLLAICGGYQLLGNYYKLRDETIKGLEILDICTEIHDGRLVGDVILETDFLKKPYNFVVGFENHGGRTYIGSHKPFGKVIYGNGNSDKCGYDGVIYRNLIGTYLHGPLLPKNPALCDCILTNALKRRYKNFEKLIPLDDALELQAHNFILNRYLKKRG